MRLRRQILSLAVWVAVGAVLTIAISWYCAAFSQVDYVSKSQRTDSPLHAPRGYRWTDVPLGGEYRVEAGWPFLALSASTKGDGRFTPAIRIARPVRQPIAGREQRYLPLQPVVPGFFANTIAFAVVSWALLALPYRLLRTTRRRTGLCPRCAYPIGRSEVCTECGFLHARNSD